LKVGDTVVLSGAPAQDGTYSASSIGVNMNLGGGGLGGRRAGPGQPGTVGGGGQ
jgi:hypothetical protein